MEYRYRYQEKEYVVNLDPRPDGGYTARIGERAYAVEMERRPSGEMILRLDGNQSVARTGAHKSRSGETRIFVALIGSEAKTYEFVRLDGGSARRSHGGISGGEMVAQMPGQVRQLLVAEGEAVSQGQPLLILEAMKMEIRVAAPFDGVVTHLLVQPGQTVERGQQLAEVSQPSQ